MKPVLLIIDMQNYFLREYRKIFIKKIIPNIKDIISISRDNKVDIIYIITKYKVDKSNWPEVYKDRNKIWCIENDDETNIIEGLEPLETDLVIIKNRFTGFYKTNLNEILQEKGIDTLFICGFAADVCIRYSTMDAYNEGYVLYWLKECMDSGFEKFEKSINHIQRLTRLNIISNTKYKGIVESNKR
jgi:nicotinamidase-related amidase